MKGMRDRLTRRALSRRLPPPLRHPLLRPLTHNRVVVGVFGSLAQRRLRRRARANPAPTVH